MTPDSRVPHRWLILSQYYPPEVGAPQIRLRALVAELRRRGLMVEVLTAMPNYPVGKIFAGYEGRWSVRERIDQVPVRRTWVYAGTGRSPLVRLANYFSFSVTAMIAALTGPPPDVLFVESQPLSLGLTAVLMKWLRGVPYIYNVPDLQIEVAEQMGFMRNGTALGAARALEDLFLRQSWRVATVTRGFVEYFRRRGVPADRVTFLPNGADTVFLTPRPPCEALLERWGLHGKKVFLYVGTHAYYHGLETVINAAHALRARSEIAFLMIGNGPERPRLEARARDLGLPNVIFSDSAYEERPKLYSIACASLATLRDIPVANSMRLAKIFPSLSCGVPVIYAGRGEGAELLVREQCGIAVPPEDPDALAAAVVRVADDLGTRQFMGERGRRLVEREYGWAGIVDRWLQEIGAVEGRPPVVVAGAAERRASQPQGRPRGKAAV